jgi:hypothetical protein
MTWPRRAVVISIVVGLALVMCAGLTVGVGAFVRDHLVRYGCQPPSYEPPLVATYSAEPLLSAGANDQSSDGPQVGYVCDRVGVDHIHTLGYTEVTYRRPAHNWQPLTDLLAAYEAQAAAEGWVYSGNRDDDQIAAVEFCRTVQGIRSTLTIAMLRGDVTGGVTTEARQVVSVPADRTCPFQADLWGPTYLPP